jgi:hypothetical protein
VAHEQLGWLPKVRLDEGLPATIAYFRGVVAPVDGAGAVRH